MYIYSQKKYEDPIKHVIKKSINASCTVYVRIYSGRAKVHNTWNIGSGFHIYNSGYVVTASHVTPPELINTFYEILLLFPGNVYYPATIAVTEPKYDCALLYAPDIINKVPSVELADSDTVEIGDLVAVISSPEGMSATATVGRVVNVHQGMGVFAPSEAWADDLIIIDADILEGSSGGMCILTDGKVAGSVMGEFGQHVDMYGAGHRAVCPSNKIKEIYRKLQEKPNP